MTNYARFYTLLSQLPDYGDREHQKATLVHAASGGRTTSLRELSAQEYRSLCDHMESQVVDKAALRKARSSALKLMTKLGVNTSDWGIVDSFCLQPRISGKVFRYLTLDDLSALSRKLRAILNKKKETPRGLKIISYDPNIIPNTLPS